MFQVWNEDLHDQQDSSDQQYLDLYQRNCHCVILYILRKNFLKWHFYLISQICYFSAVYMSKWQLTLWALKKYWGALVEIISLSFTKKRIHLSMKWTCILVSFYGTPLIINGKQIFTNIYQLLDQTIPSNIPHFGQTHNINSK